MLFGFVLFCFLVTSLFKHLAWLLSEEVAFEQRRAASCFLSWCTMLCCSTCHLKSDLWDEMGGKRSELQRSVNANGTSVRSGSVDKVLTNQGRLGGKDLEWMTKIWGGIPATIIPVTSLSSPLREEGFFLVFCLLMTPSPQPFILIIAYQNHVSTRFEDFLLYSVTKWKEIWQDLKHS